MDVQQPSKEFDLPGRPDIAVKSTYVVGYTYNSSALELTVWYKSGAVYQYSNVTPDVISNVFDKPGSIGSKVLKAIKPFKSEKLA